MPYMFSVNIFASWSRWLVSERFPVDKTCGMRSYKKKSFWEMPSKAGKEKKL